MSDQQLNSITKRKYVIVSVTATVSDVLPWTLFIHLCSGLLGVHYEAFKWALQEKVH